MLYPVIFILCVLIPIAIILFIRVNVVLEYLRDAWDDHIVISIFALGGLIKYKYEIPLVDVQKSGFKFRKIKETGPREEKKDEEKGLLKFYDLYDKIQYIKDFFKKYRDLICDIRNYLKVRLVLEQYELKVRVGAWDAYYTALTTGAVWALTGSLSAIFLNFFKVKKSKVDVKSDYHRKGLKIDFCCIFKIKIVHIIVIAFKIGKEVISFKNLKFGNIIKIKLENIRN